MSRTSRSPRNAKKQRSRLDDLGPTYLALRLDSQPRIEAAPKPIDSEFEPVGLLAELATLHLRGWRSKWTLALGPHKFQLDLSPEVGQLEELWVFLLELVDAAGGEWTITDRDAALTLDGQVYGPDVVLDLATPDESGRFAGSALPRKATLRLRALICAGTAFFRGFIKEATRMDKGMKDRSDLLAFLEDLDQLEAAVADLPGTFKGQVEA